MTPADQRVSVCATKFVYPFAPDFLALHLVQRHGADPPIDLPELVTGAVTVKQSDLARAILKPW